MNFDPTQLVKIIWILICLFTGLWNATGILQDSKAEKSFVGRIFSAIVMVFTWVLIGLLIIYFPKQLVITLLLFLMILAIFFSRGVNK